MSSESTSVSPELALVDPGLGEWARERLPAPPDTLDALAAARARPMPAPEAGARRPRRWRTRVVTWTGMLVVVAGTAFIVGSRAGDETPTAAPVAPIAEPQPPAATTEAPGRVNQTAGRTQSRGRATGAAAGPRRFAWPPAAGATGYHVELFNGSALIFRGDTKKPEILIRSRWRFGGRLRRLEAGAYRWYVWPVVAGQRAAKAIVQARLAVPR